MSLSFSSNATSLPCKGRVEGKVWVQDPPTVCVYNLPIKKGGTNISLLLNNSKKVSVTSGHWSGFEEERQREIQQKHRGLQKRKKKVDFIFL